MPDDVSNLKIDEKTYLERFEDAFGESFAFVSITHVGKGEKRRLVGLVPQVGNFLTNATLWCDPTNIDERRAVVDDGTLAAVTSRGRLISGLLDN